MPTHNFMLADLIATLQAVLLFPLFAFVPGYVLGWGLNLFDFRRQSLSWRVILSTPLSIALTPILAYLLARSLSMTAVWPAYAAAWAAFAMLCAVELKAGRRATGATIRESLPFVLIVAGWVLFAVLSLIDIQIGDRLYFPVESYDYSVRVAFTDAISRAGIPPTNPFFFPGHLVPLRYHYFWLIPCSLVDQLAGAAVDARQAVLAGTVWCGIGLMALVALFLRFFADQGERRLRQRALTGILLLAVTGLDLIPNLVLLASGRVLPDADWWNEQISSWADSLLFVPHHVAALIACLTGLLILFAAGREDRRGGFGAAIIGGGLALASAVGMSVYVALAAAICLTVWTLITFVTRRRRETVLFVLAGLAAFCLALPYAMDMRAPGAGGPLIELTVRRFAWTPVLLSKVGENLKNALLLPLNYFLEFGFFLFVGLAQVTAFRKALRLSRADLCGLAVVATAIVLVTFFRSGVISNNDFGARGALFAQFMLLIWAADLIDTWRTESRAGKGLDGPRAARDLARARLLSVALIVGVAGTLYQVFMLRAFPLLFDMGKVPKSEWVSTHAMLGKRTYAMRQAYERIRETLPRNAIVQHNPDTVFDDFHYGLYAHRQTAAETHGCGATFGGDPAACEGVFEPVRRLFSAGAPVDPNSVDEVCRSLGIDVLVVKNTDPVWLAKDSWVWRHNSMFGNDFVRVFECGMGSPKAGHQRNSGALASVNPSALRNCHRPMMPQRVITR